jgi:hypothetical protein
MSRIKGIILKYDLAMILVATILGTTLYFTVSFLFDVTAPQGLWIIWSIILGASIPDPRIEYWVRPEFRDRILGALSANHFNERCVEGEKVLFDKKQNRTGLRSFATVTNHKSHYTLEIPEAFEKKMDHVITTDMLSGGKRLVGRRLFRKKPKVQEVNG